ncbi:hypothetical protein [Halorussus litoreus]|uniref:hypothetical protein n=1 Tax=Halorussus litoreus TaxID=1710536 RepID=UPI000E270675|nr:hypothetical protein [Halorussus litoreus]
MKRLWFAVLGTLYAVVGVWFLTAFWSGVATDPASILTVALWFGASALYVLGGFGASLGGLDWYQFVGLGNVCLGLQLVVRVPFALADGNSATASLVATLAMGVGGLSLAYIGLDWVRGGRHFDLSRFGDQPGPGPE